MEYQECVDYILSIPLFSKKNGHNNTTELLKRLGNPHLALKYIHVAGTNGKGSVCSMLSHIYVEAGYQVGFFSSPHLIKMNERIKLNNKDILDQEFINIFIEIKQEIEQMICDGHHHPTFFEIVFCMAITYFANHNVDFVVLETGLGGRLDATNIIEKPLLSIITQIGLDHVTILGDTVEKIAYEKGGIIKNGCPTVLQSNENAVVQVISKICEERHSSLYNVLPFQHIILQNSHKTIDFSINNKYYEYERLTLNCYAYFQILNAATALTAIHILKEEIVVDEASVFRGLQNFYWPGRMEIVNKWLILDGAHNESGMRVFVENMMTHFADQQITLVFAVMKDKAYEDMIKELSKCPQIKRVVITCVHEGRCLDSVTMKATFEKYTQVQVEIEEDIQKVFLKSYKRDNHLLCCVGSLYLIGEIKKMITGGLQID